MSKRNHTARAGRQLSGLARAAVERAEPRLLLAAHVAGSTISYATIQAAVDAAPVGGTVTVDAGTYAGPITVSKTLTLKGANAGVDARGARGAESVISTSTIGITVTASDVTIDGFDVVGTKADVADAQYAGIILGPSIHGSHVVNDVIAENVSGLYLSNNSPTDAAVIQHDWFDDNYENGEFFTEGWNGSRQIYTDAYVSGGTLTDVLIDADLFTKDADPTTEADIGLEDQSAGGQTDIVISNSVFAGIAAKDVLAFNTTDLTIVGDECYGTSDTSAGALRFEGNDRNVVIEYDSVHDNLGPAVTIDAAGVPGDDASFTIRYDDFVNNQTPGSDIGVIAGNEQYDGTLVTTNDWWGDASGPSGDGPGTGQAVWANGASGHMPPTGAAGGTVTFAPWATSPLAITGYGVPAAPTGLSAAATGTASVALSWTAPVGTATSQLVQRSTDGVTFTTVATVAPMVTTYADAGLTGGTAYTYRIVAANTYGSSTPSGTAKAITAGGMTAAAVALSALAWTSATTGYGTIQKNLSVGGNPLTIGGKTYASGIGTHAVSTISYALGGAYATFSATVGVDGEEDGRGTGSVDFKVVGDGVTLFDSGVLSNDVAKAFTVSVAGVKSLQIVATNGVAGNIDYDHADWAGATLTTAATAAPAAPTGVTATALTATSVKLAWTAPAGATSYAVDRSTNGTTWTTVATAVAATTWTDPATLTAATKYYYRVRAANAAGTSANSAVAAVTTPAKQAATALSSLNWTSATIGWGTVHKNQSVGGNAIKVAGTTYASGIGTHAPSTIVYNLAGAYSAFTATVGIDDEEVGKGAGHADFQVYGDGVLLFDSGLLTTSQSAAVSVSVVGVRTLTLVAAAQPGGDIDYSHADWAGATLLS